MTRSLCALAIAHTILSTASGEVLPGPGQGDSRVRVATYRIDEVYRLYAWVGYEIRLEFAHDERFVALDAGDIDALTYSARDNVVAIKPRADGADMDLAITTTRRTYYFEYTAMPGRPDMSAAPVMYVVRFFYPAEPKEESAAKRTAEKIDADLAQAPSTRSHNLDYWYCGDPSLKPRAASDDGVHTRLTFAPRAELPAIFVRSADATESLLNFTVEGGDVVIHRVASQFVLRRGRVTGCVVNRGFAGSGVRLETGTVSPAVERKAQVPHP
jgi:type IV secretion system protein VirB9